MTAFTVWTQGIPRTYKDVIKYILLDNQRISMQAAHLVAYMSLE